MTVTPQMFPLVCLCAVGAGFLTASIGFGGAIFMMLFLPHFIPFLQSSALASVIVYGGIIVLALKYRKYTRWKELPVPALFYMLCSVPMVFLSRSIHLPTLKLVFSLFIITLGLYNIYGVLHAGEIQLKKNLPTTIICACLAGLGTGLFGIGGPPIALYFLAVTGGDKSAYAGTVQTFFAICMVASISARFASGILTVSMLPLAATGMAASFFGNWLGTRALNRVNVKLLKIAVCIFMIISGMISFIECL